MSETTKATSSKEKETACESIILDDGKNPSLQDLIKQEMIKVEPDLPEPEINEDQLLIDIANIKKEIHENGYQENPNMKFSVRVEVEEYNEDIRHNIKIEIHNLNQFDTNEPQSSTHQTKTKSKKLPYKLLQPLNAVTVDLKKLYNDVDEIARTSDNPADKILARELKNNWGAALRPVADNDPINAKIQEVLQKWKLFSSASKFRDVPMFYKCYICEKAWWHLSPFRDHLIIHNIDSYRMDLEEYVHESNIIAYGTPKKPQLRYLEADGECWKCNNPYKFHKPAKKEFSTYVCKRCEEIFYTCTDLYAHEGVCCQYLKDLETGTPKEISICQYCSCIFSNPADLTKHLRSRHAIRSDYPVPTQHKTCSTCNMIYFIHNLHSCPKKVKGYDCTKCGRSFLTKFMVDIHTFFTESCVNCVLCKKILSKKCMEAMHYLHHTKKFRIVYKCTMCTDLQVYLDENSARTHRILVHKNKGEKRKYYFDKVLLPQSYFPGEETVTQENNVVQPVTVITEDDDIPVLHLPEIESIYQIKEDNLDELPMAVTEIKQEVIDEEYTGGAAVVETFEPQATAYKGQNMKGIQTLVFEEPVYEPPIPPEAIKKEIKSEPIEEDYEEDIIRLSIDLPPETIDDVNVKTEPEEILDPLNVILNPETTEEDSEESDEVENIKNSQKPWKFKYSCSRCNRIFKTLRKYLLHFTNHGIPYMTCPACLKTFQDMTSLSPHLIEHVMQSYLKLRVIDRSMKRSKRKQRMGKYQCKFCKSKVEHENLYGHWDTHFKTGWKEKSNSVPMDPMSLKSEGLKIIFEHLTASKKQAKTKDCVICHRHFERNNDCKRHLIEHLLTDAYCNKPTYGALRCQICNASFQKADHYKLHMRDHGSLPVYHCELCDRAFSDSSNFTKHKKVHNLQVLICDICSKKFQAKASLIKHLELHRTTKPIICKVCSRVSYTESAYKKHVKRYHDKVDMKFKCQICGKRFCCLKDKWDHLWIIHKERKNKVDCPACKKPFRRYLDLKWHLVKEHFVSTRKPRKTDDIEEFLRDNPSLEMNESETLIVYD